MTEESLRNITPEQIGIILITTLCVMLSKLAYDERAWWLPWVRALLQRWFVVRIPQTPDELADRAPAAAPAAPGTSGAPRAHAPNPGADGARTAPAPVIGDRTVGDLLPLMQRIAAHKLRLPDDLKVATGLALGVRKSGSSQAWADYSRAWDLLYPPPPASVVAADDPAAWEPGEREGTLRRRDVISRN